MSNLKNKQLLREYVKTCLKEDTYGGYADAGISASDISSASSTYGMSFGSKSDLAKTFIEPFTDVFKTAVGKTKELSRKVRTVVPVAIGTILSTLIPWVGVTYKEVFDEEKKDLEKIKSEYKEVYERTNKALSSSDAAFLAFMSSPSLAISAWAGSKAPDFISDVLSVATGGLSNDLFDKVKKINFDEVGIETQRRVTGGGDKPRRRSESLVREAEQPSEEDIKKKIFSDEKFIKKAIDSSPRMQEMQRTATELYRSSLNEIYDQVDTLFNRVKTLDDLKKVTKKPLPQMAEIEKLQGEERQKAEETLLQGTRKAIKEFYIKNLTTQVETVLKAGIPENSQYVKDYRSTIQKIKAL